MSSPIDAIAGITSGNGALTQVANTLTSPETQSTDAAPFSDLMKDAVSEVNRLSDQADKSVRGVMSGSGVDIHEAEIATQKASMAFELALSVRNKAVQAYQSVMGMQF